MTITANLADGRVLNFPDGTDPAVIQSTVKKMLSQQSSPPPQETEEQIRQKLLANIPGQEPLAPIPDKTPVDRTLGEKAAGVGETALNLLTGATTGVVGMGGGFIEGVGKEIAGGEFGTKEAADRIRDLALKRSGQFTNTPETEAGKEFTKATGEFLEPLSALPPLAEFQALAGAARPPIKLAFAKETPTKVKVAQLLADNADDAQIAKFAPPATPSKQAVSGVASSRRVSPAAAVVERKRKLSKAAVTQGVDEGVADLITKSSKADVAAMRQSLATLKANKKKTAAGRKGAIANRPGDAAGNMLFRRYQTVRHINDRAGKEVGLAAQKLKNKKVDLSPAYEKFLDNLSDLGVVFTEKKGRIKGDYSNSEFARSKASQSILDDFVNRAKNPNMDGLTAHRLKKVIDGSIESGKRSTSKPIIQKTEGLMMGLRSDINDVLSLESKRYSAANKKFSDTIEAINQFEGISGAKFDPKAPSAGKMLTNQMRSLMSNNTNRVPALDAINGLQEVAKKYGAKFDDDIMTQVVWMDEMENLFGSSAPASFMGQIEKAVGNVADQSIRSAASGGLTGVAAEVAISAKNIARGINEENLIKSLDKLLSGSKNK